MEKTRQLISMGILCSVGFCSCSGDVQEKKGLIATDAQLVNMGKGYGFTEGPAVDKDGNVFFTDQPNDIIYKWDAVSNVVTPFLKGTGRSNGMAFDKNGYLITCADMYGEIWKIAPDGSHEVLVNNYNGKK